ncbi:MAG: uroporphyrinogen-III synthase [Sciscionella sp.]
MTEPAQAAPDTAPLSGTTVGVTADRKADELIELLRRKGADVLHGPAMRSIVLGGDEQLRADPERLRAERPDIVRVTTGRGFRGWREAAAGWGIGEEFDRLCAAARVLVRGPKAKGAVRAAGITEEWSAPGETNAELLDHLRESGVRGLRIAVQQHGQPMPELAGALREAGAEVVEVCVYRWAEPVDFAPLDRLIDATVSGGVDALTFTSAPAAVGMLSRASNTGRWEALVSALRGGVLVICVGPVTAAPLIELGVPVRQPERARTAALVRALTGII